VIERDLAKLVKQRDLRRVVERIRAKGKYRWVGLYEVTAAEIAARAWTGTEPPEHVRFPVTEGLSGSVVATGRPLVVGNVHEDPRYLTTFGSTRSEMIVPVLREGRVVGLIDVESERLHAFGEQDIEFVERCAGVVSALFGVE
jgi:GAF domain-containing protein